MNKKYKTRILSDRFNDSLVFEIRGKEDKDFMEVLIRIQTDEDTHNDYMEENDICVEMSRKQLSSFLNEILSEIDN